MSWGQDAIARSDEFVALHGLHLNDLSYARSSVAAVNDLSHFVSIFLWFVGLVETTNESTKV